MNPCSNGIQKYMYTVMSIKRTIICLNPCSNGIQKYNDIEELSKKLGVSKSLF